LHRLAAPLLLCLAVLAGPVAAAPALVVVANPLLAQPPARRADLARVFRRRQRITADGKALVPVNLPAAHPLRQAFTELLYHRSPLAMRDYWDEQYFHGISPPVVVGSQEAVLRFVHQTPGAIGYVAACRVDARVRVVLKLPLPATLRDAYRRLCRGS